ncbi:MAG: 30S ribosomal protein S8, partial [Eubacterium sp.]
DMLTRIRNANNAGHKAVEMPASKEKKAIAEILMGEGYINKVDYIEDDKQGIIKVTLKYGEDKSRVIAGLKRISKPGLRVYVGKDEIPKVLNGLGIAIISTSKGVLTDKEARRAGAGGEVICYVW